MVEFNHFSFSLSLLPGNRYGGYIDIMIAMMPTTLSSDPTTRSLTSGPPGPARAAKAGHDLLIEVSLGARRSTSDRAATTLTLSADSRSLRVLEGSGGIKSLATSDKADIKKTIDNEVLKGGAIEFRSMG